MIRWGFPIAVLVFFAATASGYGVFRDELYYIAGAIDYFRPALGLAPAVSGHNSYWLWGPGSCIPVSPLRPDQQHADPGQGRENPDEAGSLHVSADRKTEHRALREVPSDVKPDRGR